MIYDLIMLALLLSIGALGVSSFIIAKKPDAKELLDKLKPFQGWIGIAAAYWGNWLLFQFFLMLGFKGLKEILIEVLMLLSISVILISLGLIFAANKIKSVLNESANTKLDGVITKLEPLKMIFGAASLIYFICYIAYMATCNFCII